MAKESCRHCRTRTASTTRGLCHTCFRTDARDLYPLPDGRERYGGGGRGTGSGGDGRLPAVPTDARPGSPEKIAVMAERARLKLSLFHPDDAKGFDQHEEG